MARRYGNDSRTLLVFCLFIWMVTMLNLYTIGGRRNISTTISDGVHIDVRSNDFKNKAQSEGLKTENLIQKIKTLENELKQLRRFYKIDQFSLSGALPRLNRQFVLGAETGQIDSPIKSLVTSGVHSANKKIVLNSNAKDIDAELERVYKELKNAEASVLPEVFKIPDDINSDFCYLTQEDKKKFPNCQSKMAWMKIHWKSHTCYASYGVDGTPCSARYYLSQVERHCPVIPTSYNFTYVEQASVEKIEIRSEQIIESLNLELDPLLLLLDGNKYKWMRNRISSMWPFWASAKASFYKENAKNPYPKNIFIYLGLLSKKSGFKFDETAFKGGPLGEMLQWSDILVSLYILGHRIVIADELEKMHGIINSKYDNSPCPKKEVTQKFDPFDLVFTDIVGLKHLRSHIEFKIYSQLRCKLRIVDSFGTEAAFNHRIYAEQHKMASNWGGHELNLQQFYTMFPHTPDNSFMGFAIPDPPAIDMKKKKPQALVYGKAGFMWRGKDDYLNAISRFVDVHATLFVDEGKDGQPVLPSFVVNHGIVSTKKLHKLLEESMFFIGLGFPYEGPAPLEAIAFGCVFLNPVLDPPHDSLNTQFLLGKPTRRKLTSQHPYSDQFIGRPNVKTINIGDISAVEEAVKLSIVEIESGTIQPKLNREFTSIGMLERLNVYVENQNFCDDVQIWPPVEAISNFVSQDGESCVDACWNKGLICEPSYFSQLNSEKIVSKFRQCDRIETEGNLVHPSFSGENCKLQGDKLLYSCVDKEAGMARLCPCRDYIEGQVALCKECK